MKAIYFSIDVLFGHKVFIGRDDWLTCEALADQQQAAEVQTVVMGTILVTGIITLLVTS